MKKLKLLLLLLLLGMSASHTLFAQQLTHVQGEILVQLKQKATPQELTNRYNRGKDVSLHLKVGEIISRHVNIHSLTFDDQKVNENELLSDIRKDRSVEIAQFNHFVNLRSTIPDDPQFDDQWQYINTGQDGGTPGADIDMDLAWDIATGGLTPEGDTIVACIIDDGCNLNHPDIAANIWYNYAEIPNNGIDDDNNGYVDDYRGWDTGSETDQVGDGGGHGTPVAGIVGAVGNNGTGVAGVNWNVKLMIVQGGSGQESEVLKAYSYPLEARIRYNETNGEEGAFVVTTNASWGTDFGQPADAPLWCAFYDTLGIHGILNTGATINGNENIDEVGDLPTACPSDYLLSITNMNRNDVKVTQAGFGPINVDLGAFGQDTWTLSLNSYNGFGGTSGATPHVTGTIALMYSAPCPNFTSLAKDNPGAAALLAKQYIMEGVDPNASLEGITVTGGRLNVHNSLQLLMAACSDCLAPFSISVEDVIDTMATLSWNTLDTSIVANLQYRPTGSSDWTTIENVEAPLALSSLVACTDYEVQLYSICDSLESDTSQLFTFTTDGCCDPPSTSMITAVTDSSAMVSWSDVLAAISYNVQIKADNDTTWQTFNTLDTLQSFVGLDSCTNYEVRIQTICESDTTDFGESIFFITKGCGACTDLAYCDAGSYSTEYEWIASVEVNDLINESGANEGYGDFTSSEYTTTLMTYNTYDITLTPGFDGFAYDEFFGVWIDYNQDGDFDDADEEVYVSPSTQTTITGSFTIPATALEGLTRMRIVMIYEDTPTACDDSGEGEVEDYCITIEAGVAPQPCLPPTSLEANELTQTTASLQWDAMEGTVSYNLRYQEAGGSNWIESPITENSMTLENLIECTTYEVEVQAVCESLSSMYSDKIEFTTECVNSTNNLAGDLQSIEVFPNPFTEQITVAFSFQSPKDAVTISLVNQLGQTILVNRQTDITRQPQRVTLNSENLPAGVYFLKMNTSDGGVFVQKVVKSSF
jgi:serine protease